MNKEIKVKIPESVALAAEQAIRDGFFASLDDLVRVSLQQFLYAERLRAIEESQLEDIRMAVKAAS